MKIVCISDTHFYPLGQEIPEGDVLVHAGDLTIEGNIGEVEEAMQHLAALPHKHKVVIAGNHDFLFQRSPDIARALVPKSITYLQDFGVELDGVRFWGSPWVKDLSMWAFNASRAQRGDTFAGIPAEVDVLITHMPPYGIRDVLPAYGPLGCDLLLEQVERVRPKLHVFGHIHSGYGITTTPTRTYINAAMCDEAYKHGHPPIVFDLEI